MKNIDIYGEPIRILLNKKHKIQTSIGGFFTIITVFLVILFTWFIGKDIIYKKKPISYMETDIENKYNNITISNENFPFSFNVFDDFNHPLNDFSYFSLKLYELEYGFDTNNTVYFLIDKIEHPIKFCNYSDFPLITKEQFDYAQLSASFCPINRNFNLFGYWNEEGMRYLQISIEICQDKNETNSSSLNSNMNNYSLTNINQNQSEKENNIIFCKSGQEIKEYIAKTGTNLNINFINTKVIINNNTDPIQHVPEIQYKYVLADYYKRTTFKIESHNIQTDNGFIFNSDQIVSFFKLREDSTEIKSRDELNPQLIDFEIYSSNISQTYYRRYIKIPDIIAFLGGILKLFTFMFINLNFYFSEVEKNICLLNEIFVLNNKSDKTNNSINIFKLNNKNNKFRGLKDYLNDYDYKKSSKIKEDSLKNDLIIKNNSNLSEFNSYLNSSQKKIKENNNKNKTSIHDDNLVGIQNITNIKKNLHKSPNKKVKINSGKLSKKNENRYLESRWKSQYMINRVVKTTESKNLFTNNSEDIQNLSFKISQNGIIKRSYIKILREEFKLNSSIYKNFFIICKKYCKFKIPKNFLDEFNFYEIGRSSLEYYFDIIFMIKKFEELNILKKCVLSDIQLNLLEILNKPIITTNDLILNLNFLTNSEQKINYIQKFFLLMKKNPNVIDKKIYDIIQERVKNCNV